MCFWISSALSYVHFCVDLAFPIMLSFVTELVTLDGVRTEGSQHVFIHVIQMLIDCASCQILLVEKIIQEIYNVHEKVETLLSRLISLRMSCSALEAGDILMGNDILRI